MSTTMSCMTHAMANERLPWLANGTLPEDERSAVAAHVETCAICQEDLLLCDEMARAVRSDSAVPIPPAATADVLLRNAGTRQTSRRLRDWRMAAAIALVSLTAIISVLQFTRTHTPNQRFTTTMEATSLATVDYVFELQFASGVDDAARVRVLSELGGSVQVVDADRREYRVTLALPPQSLADLDARAAGIAARSEVDAANVIAVQVPVR